jgi:hypothetical protein
MYNPKPCPNCGHLNLESDRTCSRCRYSLGLSWVNWLPAIVSLVFALLMAAFIFFIAMPATAKAGRPDKIAYVAINLTNVIFIGGAALLGAFLGWLVSKFIKAAGRR